MKRDHPERHIMAGGDEIVGGDDELLAALGYKVRASDMADVAQKLEQLEVAMGGAHSHDDDALLSHLATDTVHYNPSDIAHWLENMLSELAPDSADAGAYDAGDLRAIPGELVCKQSDSSSSSSSAGQGKKRQKTAAAEESGSAAEETKTVVLVDAQETGIRLVHTLMASAEAIQQDELKAADALVKDVSVLAVAQAGPMRKVATYFADALARRIFYSRYYPRSPPQAAADPLDPSISDVLEMNFYEASPYLKFAHFTANQAILEAFAGKSRVHVIDFGMKQGMQWPALMQALALRPGGPPVFRLTGIGPPQPNDRDALQQVGWRLARLAETVGVEFEYRGFVAASLADLEPYMLDVRPGVEAVAVNSVMELHRLLAQPGAAEKVLATVRAVAPDVFTVVEQEAEHNGPVFLDRFTEALHYYSTMFDSFEGGGNRGGGGEEQVMAEMYVGRQISNVVASEGAERVERHEKMARWRGRLEAAGFAGVHLGSNAFKQASMLLALFAGGDGYRVEEKDGCLMLGWHTRPLIATSAWRVAAR